MKCSLFGLYLLVDQYWSSMPILKLCKHILDWSQNDVHTSANNKLHTRPFNIERGYIQSDFQVLFSVAFVDVYDRACWSSNYCRMIFSNFLHIKAVIRLYYVGQTGRGRI